MDKHGTWMWWDIKPNFNHEMWFIMDNKKRVYINRECTNPDRLHPDYWKNSLQERPKPTEPDYSHLLPEGYEFCEEEQAEKWVKVESKGSEAVGIVVDVSNAMDMHIMDLHWKPFYRPIRPIKYHVAVHEVVTIEPDPYQPDWTKAPEETVAHAYDKSELGYWYKIVFDNTNNLFTQMSRPSNLRLPSGLDWKNSLRVNPKLK
jgi:hypothetical protein